MLLLYFGKVGADTILAEGNIEYAITGSKDSIVQAEYDCLHPSR